MSQILTSGRRARGNPGVRARLVWALAALGLAGIVFTTWVEFGGRGAEASGADAGGAVVLSTALAVFVLSGAVIVSRQPGNVIGWLLIIPGLSIPLSELIGRTLYSLDPPPTAAGFWLWLTMWFVSWSWILLIFPVFHLLLTFPTGRLVSPRWRWAGWLEGTMVATMLGLAAFGEELSLVTEDDTTLWSVTNPIGFVPESAFDFVFGSVWSLCLFILTAAGVAAVIVRFHRAEHGERQQIKWLLSAVSLFGLGYGISALFSGEAQGALASVLNLLFALSLTAIPAAVAIAVLRYRLYEIDRIVSRTVSYTVIVVFLAAVYVGGVTWLTSWLPDQSQLVVAATTLAVAALFNPVRKRVQVWVDRRFNRSRYDAQRVMDQFAGSLRDQVDSDEVVDGWVGVVSETMQPAAVAVWVKGGP